MHTLKRLFTLYISFFLVVLLLMIPLLNLIIAEVEQHTLRTNEEVLAAGLQRLEDELRLITVAASTLYRSPQMRTIRHYQPSEALSYTYGIMQARSFFSDITGVLNTPSDVGIIYKNGSLLASGLFHQTTEAYYGTHLRAQEAATYEAWRSLLSREDASYSFTPMHIESSSCRDAIVFSLPLPLNSTNWENALFFAILDAADIIDMLLLPNMRGSTTLTLTTRDGAVLLEHTPSGIENPVLVQRTSPVYALSAQQQISHSVVRSVLDGFFRLLMVCLAIYILLGIVLAIVYAYRNAKPINEMIGTAQRVHEETGGLSSPEAERSGYEYVSTVLDETSERLRINRAALENQKIILCENLFERLLRGEVFSADTFDIAEQYLADIPPQWRMAIVQLLEGGDMNLLDYSTLRLSMMDISRGQLPSGTSMHFSGNMMILLLPYGDASVQSLSACAQNMRALREALAESLQAITRIAISAPWEGIREINTAFRQLRQLLRVKGTSERLLLWEEYASGAGIVYTSRQNSHHFYEFLVRGNADMALQQLDGDIASLRLQKLVSDADLQQLFYVYRHALTLAANDYPFLAAVGLPRFTAQDNLDKTFEPIRTACTAMCAMILEHQVIDRECFDQKILKMIDENIANPELYAKMVTAHFDISESSLQRSMRKATGQSFFEYVEAKRMKMAQALVEDSAQPLSDIVTACGYSSSNSFYKAFRSTFGMSPSAMRTAALRKQHGTDR